MQEPKLAAPGDGIGGLEMFALQWIFKPFFFRNAGAETAIRRLIDSADEVQSLLSEIDEARLTERVLVDRPFFVEDSSRFWSAAMLCRHLAKIDGMLARAIESGADIPSEKVPPARERLAAVKPELERNLHSACGEFRGAVAALTSAARGKSADELSRRRIPHPWLGQISHLQWLWFAGFHHRVHARQLKMIARELRRPSHSSAILSS